MKTKLIILDRDGTLNYQPKDGDWVRRWRDLRIIPNTLRHLKRLQKAGYVMVVFTNQSCIGRAKCDLFSIVEVNKVLMDKLPMIDDVYMCPHKPEDDCRCRKPKPGMLKEIAKRYDPNMRDSYVIGNDQRDWDSAKAAGFKCIPVLTDVGIEFAVDKILNKGGK